MDTNIILIIIGLITGYLSAFIYEYIMLRIGKKFNKNGKPEGLIIKGYKLHHSIYGLISFLISVFFINNQNIFTLIIGFGVGIITQHSFAGEGLVFITLEK